MCRGGKKPGPQYTVADPKKVEEELDVVEAKPVIEEDDVATVEYGDSKKDSAIQAKRQGAESLKIALNDPAGQANQAKKGGLNIG